MSDDAHNDASDAALAKMSSWVSAIADNLNNPIGGVNAALTILERELTHCRDTGDCRYGAMEDSIRRIRERMQTLGDYVSELINVVRPGEARPSQVDVSDLFADLCATMAGRAVLSLECCVASGAEAALADPTRLKAVLKALIVNGLEASGAQDQPRVRLAASPANRGDKRGIVLSVEDNGHGFGHEALRRGHEPFYSTKEAGTGLGLAVAKKFVEAHGGVLELGRSETLGGAAVTLFLPHESGGSP